MCRRIEVWFTAPAFEPGTSVDSYPEDGRGVAVVRPAEVKWTPILGPGA